MLLVVTKLYIGIKGVSCGLQLVRPGFYFLRLDDLELRLKSIG